MPKNVEEKEEEEFEMKEEKSLEKSEIKYGELHIYYPLKFDTKLEIEEICQKICQSSMVFNCF